MNCDIQVSTKYIETSQTTVKRVHSLFCVTVFICFRLPSYLQHHFLHPDGVEKFWFFGKFCVRTKICGSILDIIKINEGSDKMG